MTGTDQYTGRSLSGDAHLAQSIGKILGTRIGTRVCRRDFGSYLPDLIDAPMNAANRLRVFAATVLAIVRWEPRVRHVGQLQLLPVEGERGRFALVLDLEKTGTPTSALTRLTIPLQPN